ncbi:EF-hand domain-containing protein [Fundidesulfovibrio butyratiphilus]
MKRLVSLLCAVVLLFGAGSLAMAQGKAGSNRGAAGFKAADANGDGKVTKEEYLNHARKLAEKRWEKLDTGNKGYITVQDVQTLKQKRAEAREARRAAKAGRGPGAAPAATDTSAPAAAPAAAPATPAAPAAPTAPAAPAAAPAAPAGQ